MLYQCVFRMAIASADLYRLLSLRTILGTERKNVVGSIFKTTNSILFAQKFVGAVPCYPC
jgi:hypothetical protein